MKSVQTSLKRGSLWVSTWKMLAPSSCRAWGLTRGRHARGHTDLPLPCDSANTPPPASSPHHYFCLSMTWSDAVSFPLLAPLRHSFSLSPVFCFSFQWRGELSSGPRVLVKQWNKQLMRQSTQCRRQLPVVVAKRMENWHMGTVMERIYSKMRPS